MNINIKLNINIMKKTLIYPVYNDIHKLHDIISVVSKDIEVYIYEKKNEILDISINHHTYLDNNIIHYNIPLIGEQHFSFFLHIINNYNHLEGIIHFSKTHWIPVFSTMDTFLQELYNNDNELLYVQHKTNMRQFVCIFPDIQYMGFKDAITFLLKQNNINIYADSLISYNKECFECNNNIKCFNCGLFYNETCNEIQNVLFSTSYLKENSICMQKLKEIFDDYNPVTEYNPCTIDGSYIIHSNVILFHTIDVYESIYNDLKNNVFGSHDEIVIFFHLFFKETLRRYNNTTK